MSGVQYITTFHQYHPSQSFLTNIFLGGLGVVAVHQIP